VDDTAITWGGTIHFDYADQKCKTVHDGRRSRRDTVNLKSCFYSDAACTNKLGMDCVPTALTDFGGLPKDLYCAGIKKNCAAATAPNVYARSECTGAGSSTGGTGSSSSTGSTSSASDAPPPACVLPQLQSIWITAGCPKAQAEAGDCAHKVTCAELTSIKLDDCGAADAQRATEYRAQVCAGGGGTTAGMSYKDRTGKRVSFTFPTCLNAFANRAGDACARKDSSEIATACKDDATKGAKAIQSEFQKFCNDRSADFATQGASNTPACVKAQYVKLSVQLQTEGRDPTCNDYRKFDVSQCTSAEKFAVAQGIASAGIKGGCVHPGLSGSTPKPRSVAPSVSYTLGGAKCATTVQQGQTYYYFIGRYGLKEGGYCYAETDAICQAALEQLKADPDSDVSKTAGLDTRGEPKLTCRSGYNDRCNPDGDGSKEPGSTESWFRISFDKNAKVAAKLGELNDAESDAAFQAFFEILEKLFTSLGAGTEDEKLTAYSEALEQSTGIKVSPKALKAQGVSVRAAAPPESSDTSVVGSAGSAGSASGPGSGDKSAPDRSAFRDNDRAEAKAMVGALAASASGESTEADAKSGTVKYATMDTKLPENVGAAVYGLSDGPEKDAAVKALTETALEQTELEYSDVSEAKVLKSDSRRRATEYTLSIKFKSTVTDAAALGAVTAFNTNKDKITYSVTVGGKTETGQASAATKGEVKTQTPPPPPPRTSGASAGALATAAATVATASMAGIMF
jgi:hypothetical protein